MPAFFCDSSAVVKRYVNETGTTWIASLLDPAAGNRIYIAEITGVEVVSAVTRRQRSGSLTPAEAALVLGQLRHHLIAEYRAVAITTTLLTRASVLAERHALRGYDAVQLAAALTLNNLRLARGQLALILVSSDAELNAAATLEGLMVEDPASHP